MKKISIKNVQAKLKNAQIVDAVSKKNLKGGGKTDPPPFGGHNFTDPPPFGGHN